MKILKRIAAAAMCAALMAAAMPITAKADEDLTVITNVNKDLEIPLTLDASTEDFFFQANFDPGDVLKASVTFKNVSSEDIQVRISDVTDQIGTTESMQLLDILNLTVTAGGSTIYSGKHSAVTNPLTQWMTLSPTSELVMEIQVEMPKYEADNSFQGSEMKVKYVFEARADVDLDSGDYLNGLNSEKIKTGADDTSSTNPIAVALVIVAAVAAVGFGAYAVVDKKKKDNEGEGKA